MTVSTGQAASPAALLACMSRQQMRLAEPEDGHQGLIDTPLLLRARLAYEFAKPPRVDGADDAGLALRDVGATSTTERGRSSLA